MTFIREDAIGGRTPTPEELAEAGLEGHWLIVTAPDGSEEFVYDSCAYLASGEHQQGMKFPVVIGSVPK